MSARLARSRFDARLQSSHGRTGLIPFVTAGDPSPEPRCR